MSPERPSPPGSSCGHKGRSGERGTPPPQHCDFGDTMTAGIYLLKHKYFGVWPFPLPEGLIFQEASARPSGGYERRFSS